MVHVQGRRNEKVYEKDRCIVRERSRAQSFPKLIDSYVLPLISQLIMSEHFKFTMILFVLKWNRQKENSTMDSLIVKDTLLKKTITDFHHNEPTYFSALVKSSFPLRLPVLMTQPLYYQFNFLFPSKTPQEWMIISLIIFISDVYFSFGRA